MVWKRMKGMGDHRWQEENNTMATAHTNKEKKRGRQDETNLH